MIQLVIITQIYIFRRLGLCCHLTRLPLLAEIGAGLSRGLHDVGGEDYFLLSGWPLRIF